jgi:hypothetical protein
MILRRSNACVWHGGSLAVRYGSNSATVRAWGAVVRKEDLTQRRKGAKQHLFFAASRLCVRLSGGDCVRGLARLIMGNLANKCCRAPCAQGAAYSEVAGFIFHAA